MIKKYDLVFGIGSACLCSQLLRKLHLQFSSYPLDWLYGRGFSYRVELLVSEFRDFINQEDLIFENTWNGDRKNPCDVYKNQRTGIVFNHDFPQGVPLEKSFDQVRQKYDRRIKRLIGKIKQSKQVLIVYTEVPGNTEDMAEQDLGACLQKIKDHFPDQEIDLLYISCCSTSSDERYGEHIRKLSFDYKNKNAYPLHDARLLRKRIKNDYVLRRTFSERFRGGLFRLKKHLKGFAFRCCAKKVGQ